MRHFYIVFLLVFLASCSEGAIESSSQAPSEIPSIVEQKVDERNIPNASDDTNSWDIPEQDDEGDEVEIQEVEAVVETSQDISENLNAQVASDIDTEVEILEETVSNQLITLDASYNNPKGNVDMVINYEVDKNGMIESIWASATTYDLSRFNSSIQSLVWKSISEAEDHYTAGSSLTSEAFTRAIKNR